ncbi:isopentenyl-diphosphate Delta-isomerase [Streptosporangium sp. NBC_01755]|uniref:isopentenyl-diphosphate Delta-isomerase n=1 Tax=unclassified Streptosporangium TaxID=2632669 RepID=UPI002DD7BD5B|nr:MULTISPECIES: isopentenyl-diphosphate Delta-isomerase [unclassified Streptosporangium]WSA25288.1 isopentenyl-diphosphate Delta-isomerase [Streptosporangium sp. NBC_01810]WSD03395.1 isopentenyl-diphosphate Delta-isomerase [Streptosporangium sp. NBC_01755]
MTPDEHVVLVDTEGNAIGTAAKATVHGLDTPLHLAFSSYVFDEQGQVLLSRRALHKITWPGVWTNSCCGHPLPGEPLAEAVTRRLSHELGLAAGQVDLLLPRFSYRAVMDDGIVERELCPVYRVIAASEVAPNPDEVEDVRWMPWKEFTDGVLSDRLAISPWCREQVPQLIELGVDPLAWRTADPADLPSAAR